MAKPGRPTRANAARPATAKPAAGEKKAPHSWAFKASFRRQAFGWRSQPAITRVREAVAEIKKVAKKEPVLAGEGAVIFLERVSPAIEQVDGSSGSVGAAGHGAIVTLVPIIAAAPADAKAREDWLTRLMQEVGGERARGPR